ncbi:MAG: HAD family hydrolase, partial [Oscillospiraceae bacterium]|nr:HAD family hydrolase [Oscillospiraceae bacterium]
MTGKFTGYTIISDFDGTILPLKTTEIPRRNITEKRRFEALGGKFIMATGRSADSARPYAKQLELKYPSVYHNGASIYDYSSEKYVATRPILRDEAAGFFAELMLRFPE